MHERIQIATKIYLLFHHKMSYKFVFVYKFFNVIKLTNIY